MVDILNIWDNYNTTYIYNTNAPSLIRTKVPIQRKSVSISGFIRISEVKHLYRNKYMYTTYYKS